MTVWGIPFPEHNWEHKSIFFPFVPVKVRFITLALWYNEGIRVYLKKNHGCFAGASHKTALAKNRLFSPFQVHPRQKCKQQA